MRLKLVPDETKYAFTRLHRIFFALSLALIVASLGLFFTRGMVLGIDFTGGIVMEMRTAEPVDLAVLRKAVEGPDVGDTSLQFFGSDLDIMLRAQSLGDDQAAVIQRLKTSISDAVPVGIEYRKVDFVGPQVGEELIRGGSMAMGFAFLAILIYVWFRFEWQFGMGAILALVHDSILAIGFYVLMGLEFNLSSIAAILTIIGYSINDSVVIYDRVRENLRKYKKMAIPELIDLSLNETLSRTVMTGGTTLLALLALIVFGGEVIRGFSLVIFFGVVVGTYSSIFIAAPVLLYTQLRHEEKPIPGTSTNAA